MRYFSSDEWVSVNEEWREYFLVDRKTYYRIQNPRKLFVSKTGTHFVEDDKGLIYTIQNEKFLTVVFYSKDGLQIVEPSIR